MTDSTERLSTRLDELASSLHRAGAPGDDTARLLELAALATFKAVELELLAAGRNEPRRPAQRPAEPIVIVAAERHPLREAA